MPGPAAADRAGSRGQRKARTWRGAATSSRYKGVSLNRRDGYWTAQIRIGGRLRHLGSWPVTEQGEVAAARAYDAAAAGAFGAGALLNFPPAGRPGPPHETPPARCGHCGQEMPSARAGQRYCRGSCRQAAYRAGRGAPPLRGILAELRLIMVIM